MSRTSNFTRRAIHILQLLAGLAFLLAAGAANSSTLDVVIQQFEVIGPRQWLWFAAGPLSAVFARPLSRSRTRVAAVAAGQPHSFVAANDNARVGGLARAS
jgi:hypothetical protein